jgi:hypothetical protein
MSMTSAERHVLKEQGEMTAHQESGRNQKRFRPCSIRLPISLVLPYCKPTKAIANPKEDCSSMQFPCQYANIQCALSKWVSFRVEEKLDKNPTKMLSRCKAAKDVEIVTTQFIDPNSHLTRHWRSSTSQAFVFLSSHFIHAFHR